MASTARRPARGPLQQLEGIRRLPDEGIVGGVAAGVGVHLGVDPVVVRLAFVVLTLASGTGLLTYLFLWALLPSGDAPRGAAAAGAGRGIEQAIAVGLVTVGSLLLLRRLGVWFPDRLVWPAALVAVGFGLVWARTDQDDRDRWRERASRLPGDPSALLNGGRAMLLRLVAGVVLLFAGLAAFVAANDRFAAAGQIAMAVLVAAVGASLLLGPWVVRLARELTDERRERIRSEERADMAAHLHDSVLQTLALIQRRATSPQETVALARRQERELRAWLYGDRARTSASGSLVTALGELVDHVEADFAVTVDLVTVGDGALDDRGRAVVAATREAMVNAAKHGGVGEVSVFAEVEPGRVTVFVRDRGRGFDPSAVDPDRQGLAASVVGRMARHGGTATITSSPGEGTEVCLEMPLGAP